MGSSPTELGEGSHWLSVVSEQFTVHCLLSSKRSEARHRATRGRVLERDVRPGGRDL